ncbi:MAG TPA: nucleotidyltransferase domain-containing protein [Vicinamibacterales bacterium]|jgi:predicted nucleotidyltransferase|nr:nucleotidyltransferase domain-containing protein [Vicinamibacterales bacterium]
MRAPAFPSVARAVARSVAGRRNVQAAYIFGSTATGRSRPESDVDVAVLLAQRPGRGRTLTDRLRLIADLDSALHRSDVDVVILNDAPPLLAHRILSKGRLVFERSASARVRFQVRTAARYLDLIPMFETHIRYLRKKVREGRVVG